MEFELETLMVGGAVLAAWLVGQVVAWTRMPREERPEVGQFIGRRFARDWPLLVVLLAPLAARAVAPDQIQWLVIAVIGIIVWWVAEAEGALVQPPTLEGDPLRCAAAAVQKLLRSRWLLVVLVGLWLVACTGHDIERMVYIHNHPDAHAPEPQQSWAADVREHFSVSFLTTMLAAEFSDSFPSARDALSTAWLYVLIALTVGFGYLRFGSALPPDRRARMAWPFRLTALYALVGLHMHSWWFSPGDYGSYDASSPAGWITALVTAFIFLWGAPAYAAVWHMMLQVIRGDGWHPRRSLVVASETWELFVAPLLLLYLPRHLATPPFLPPGLPSEVLDVYSGVLADSARVARTALILVPWIIIDRRVGLRVALEQTWALATSRAPAVGAFVLRYAAVMAVLTVTIHLLAPMRWLFSPSHFVRFQVLGAVELLGALAVGVLYLRLRGTASLIEEE